jgi:hypothetical protein
MDVYVICILAALLTALGVISTLGSTCNTPGFRLVISVSLS